MRISIARISIALALNFMGCTSESDDYREKREFTDAQKSGCPAHPFKPEFQGIRKTGAGQALDLRIKIHDYQGYLIKTILFQNISGPSVPPMQLMWDFKDDNGNAVKSGYYYWSITDLATDEERVQCTFYVNPADQDKVQ